METTTFLLIVIAAITALFLASFQYLFKTKIKSQLNYWLSFFRFLSIFSILILLINPSTKKENIEVIKPILAVAVDNSTSIKYSKQESAVKNLIQQLNEDVALNNKFSIQYFSFGNSLHNMDTLGFTENQTNLAAPFKEFSILYKSAITPVILISDGNQTVGKNVEFINYRNPVYPFIVGDTTIVEDLLIDQLNINKYTYINNRFPVELFIRYSGNKQISKKFTISYNGKQVYTQILQFSKIHNIQIASFYLTATQKGTQYYSARIETLKNEQHTLNNSKNFSINVIEDQSNILILSAITHPDLGMFKKSIESNKQRSVTISDILDFKGNLNDYQLVILYQPTSKFKDVFNDIINLKLNYFIVSGTSTDWVFLNKIQSNFKKEAISSTENYNPVFNPNYASFSSNDIGFSNFAPLVDKFGELIFTIPYNSFLFQKIGNIETEKPLLVTYDINNQKGALLQGENVWKWRMNSFLESRSFELFDSFISRFIQFLATNSDKNRLEVNSKPLFYSNEIIQITASYLDANFNFDPRAKIWLIVTKKQDDFIKKIPFTLLNNKFNVSLSNIPSGEYMYTVSVENQTEIASGSFKLEPFEIEQQFVQSNNKQLKILASKTGGKIYYNRQGNDLIVELISENRYKNIQKVHTVETPLIDWKWILGFVLLTLSIEWFTRKYYGKI